MKASELIKKIEHYIKEEGDCEIYTWCPNQMNHIPITTIRYIDDSFFGEELVDEDYYDDYRKIRHNIVIG